MLLLSIMGFTSQTRRLRVFLSVLSFPAPGYPCRSIHPALAFPYRGVQRIQAVQVETHVSCPCRRLQFDGSSDYFRHPIDPAHTVKTVTPSSLRLSFIHVQIPATDVNESIRPQFPIGTTDRCKAFIAETETDCYRHSVDIARGRCFFCVDISGASNQITPKFFLC